MPGEQTGAVVVELGRRGSPCHSRGDGSAASTPSADRDAVGIEKPTAASSACAEGVAEVQQPALTAVELVDLDEPLLDAEHVLDQRPRSPSGLAQCAELAPESGRTPPGPPAKQIFTPSARPLATISGVSVSVNAGSIRTDCGG